MRIVKMLAAMTLSVGFSVFLHGAAKEDFKKSLGNTIYRFIIEESTDIQRIENTQFLQITSENEEHEVRIRVLPIGRLQSITKKVSGPHRVSDKFITVLFEPVKEISGGEISYSSVELIIDQEYLTLEEVIELFK